MKKVFGAIILALFVFSLVPLGAFAEDSEMVFKVSDKQTGYEKIHQKVGDIIINAESLEIKLDSITDRLAEKENINMDEVLEKIDNFHENVEKARESYENSEDSFTSTSKQELRESYKYLKQAQKELKLFVGLLKGYKNELLDKCYEKRPKFKPGNELGYFIWYSECSDAAWTIIWNGDLRSWKRKNTSTETAKPKMHEIEGTIKSTSDIFDITLIAFEKGDTLDKTSTSSNEIKFRATVGPHFDGLRFKTEGIVTFDISIDGEKNPDLVYLHQEKSHPREIPFELAPSLTSWNPKRICSMDEVLVKGRCISDTQSELVEGIPSTSIYEEGTVVCNQKSMIGDTNSDKEITLADAISIKAIYQGQKKVSNNICCVDVNRDKAVDETDYELVRNFYFENGQDSGYTGNECDDFTLEEKTGIDETLEKQEGLGFFKRLWGVVFPKTVKQASDSYSRGSPGEDDTRTGEDTDTYTGRGPGRVALPDKTEQRPGIKEKRPDTGTSSEKNSDEDSTRTRGFWRMVFPKWVKRFNKESNTGTDEDQPTGTNEKVYTGTEQDTETGINYEEEPDTKENSEENSARSME